MTNEKELFTNQVTTQVLFLLWYGFLFVCLFVCVLFCGEDHLELNSGLGTCVTEICYQPLFYLLFFS